MVTKLLIEMKINIKLLFFVGFLGLLQSCNIQTETSYYKDSATSMQSTVLMDQSMMGMMNMTNQNSDSKSLPGIGNLTTDWKSLFDLQKQGKVILNPDSTKVLKKMFLKLNKSNGELTGISLKYDKLMPQELQNLFSQSKSLNKLPLQNFGNWDGKTLTIDTDKFNSTDFIQQISQSNEDKKTTETPKSKADSMQVYGEQLAKGMFGMMKLVNLHFSNTLKFQKPIKSIVGKHDFVKQIDDRTILINVNSRDLMNEKKKLTNQDKKIIITTE